MKNDQVAFEAGMSFNMGQLLSLPFIFAGIGLIIWTKAKPRYFSREQIAQVR
jgi:phosphatidylglycerol:prolipoprotein diacylglycerol transferase